MLNQIAMILILGWTAALSNGYADTIELQRAAAVVVGKEIGPGQEIFLALRNGGARLVANVPNIEVYF